RSEGKNSIGSLYKGSRYSVLFYDDRDRKTFIEYLAKLSIELSDEVSRSCPEGAVALYLPDSRGAERNIHKIISAALNVESALSRCSIVRECCYADYEPKEGRILSLYEAL
ncbi:MAG: hypothetical protein RBT72_02145, partial [Spirochaetia bacterium]|nr:hypothetical protein [Spirochaetia bacterium]